MDLNDSNIKTHCKSRSEIFPWSVSIKLFAVRSHSIITCRIAQWSLGWTQCVLSFAEHIIRCFFEGPNNWTLYRDRYLYHSHTLFKTILKRFTVVFQTRNKLCSTDKTFKADSHIACHAHAVPMPYRSLIHTCPAAPMPCSDSAVSFVKVRVVAGNIRTVVQEFNRSSVL
jgi:hypothetical protein